MRDLVEIRFKNLFAILVATDHNLIPKQQLKEWSDIYSIF